jgi:hypothetical protein
MEIRVLYPDGRNESLLNVPNYSFAWQTAYKPRSPIRIPSGSKIMVTGVFDNSAKNKFNPDATKPVRHGEPTYDEMMMGFLDYVVEKPARIAKVDHKVFDGYVGRYDLGNNRTYAIIRDGDKFYGQATGNPRREMFAVSDSVFSIPEIEAQLTFVKGEKGEIKELLYERGDGVLHCKRVKDEAPATK